MKFSKNEMSGKFISKSLSRYLVVQAIFNESFGFDKNRIRDDFVSEKDIKFFIDMQTGINKEKYDKKFFLKIYDNVFEKEELINKLINKFLRNDWSISRLPKILHAILKAAISEMISFPKTSIGIIISEYLIIAESFSIENENKFINAILDNVNKNLESDG